MNAHIWGVAREYQVNGSIHAQPIYSPVLFDEISKLNAIAVASGDAHTVILTDCGDVYTVGRGIEGQLGRGKRINDPIPQLVSSLRHETITAVACGSSTSYAITSSGRVYLW